MGQFFVQYKRNLTSLFFLVFITALTVGCTASQGGNAERPAFYTPPDWKRPIVRNNSHSSPARSVKKKPASNFFQETKNFTPKTNRELQAPPPEFTKNDSNQMEGVASWYGPGFHGKLTAKGETYNQNDMTAAHRHLPIGTWVRVRNRDNGKNAVVRINDRGPYKKNRIIDLSRKAAIKLGVYEKGTANVSLEIIQLPKTFDQAKGLEAYKQTVVQVAVFKNQRRASTFKEQLADRFEELAFFVDEMKPGLYYVVVGPYDNRGKAKGISSDLKQQGIPNFVRSFRK